MIPADEAIRLLSYADISRLSGVPVGTLRVWRQRGKLPEPDYHLQREVAWKPETITKWLNATQLEKENGK